MFAIPVSTASLVSSTLLLISTNSWVMIWALLEINTLSFCTLLIMESKSFGSKESSPLMKYFIIQAGASAILIMANVSMSGGFSWFYTTAPSLALMTKLASAPVHSWFMEITKKMSWKSAALLMTWQKLAPIYLMTFIYTKLLTVGLVLSALMGSVHQMYSKKVMEILTASSVFNVSWMMASSMVSLKVVLVFSMLYWTSLIMVVISLKSVLSKSVSQSIEGSSRWFMMLAMVSLGGIPPSMGFLAKMFVAISMVSLMMMPLLVSLMVLSSINLFIYMRMVISMPMGAPTTKNKTNQMKLSNMSWTFLSMNTPAIVILTYLDKAWKSIILME